MTFNCTDAMAEVSKDFRSLPLETRAGKTINLKAMFLLPDDGLKSALAILGSMDSMKKDDPDSVLGILPKMRDLLLLVADDAKTLAKEMEDWPMGMFMSAISAWQEATELGEAQPSDS